MVRHAVRDRFGSSHNTESLTLMQSHTPVARHSQRIISHNGFEFLDNRELIQNITIIPELHVYALLMYYCAPSEVQTNLHIFDQESKYSICKHDWHIRAIQKVITPKDFEKVIDTETYKIYQGLYNRLIQNFKWFVNIKTNMNLETFITIQNYCEEIGVKDYKRLPRIWKRQIQKFLFDAEILHKYNIETRDD